VVWHGRGGFEPCSIAVDSSCVGAYPWARCSVLSLGPTTCPVSALGHGGSQWVTSQGPFREPWELVWIHQTCFPLTGCRCLTGEAVSYNRDYRKDRSPEGAALSPGL
jgi:hypothetical protein